jgi:hypothetical protein
MSSSSVEPGGLELLNTDTVTPEEIKRFREFYTNTKHSQNKSYEFWLEFGPDVVKRHKSRTVLWHSGPETLLGPMPALHQYICQAFRDGIEYEMILSQTLGASKSDLLDLVSVAFIHSGHPGMYLVAETMTDFFRDYEQKEGPGFPAGWAYDATAFDSGMDYSTLGASKQDLDKLFAWYEQNIGEIPRYVQMLAKYRPDLLKAYRNRYEHAIRESLPKQMMPYVHIHYNVFRGFSEAIRENILLAKAFGLKKSQVLDAVFSAILHTGANGLDTVDRAAGDLLESYPEV